MKWLGPIEVAIAILVAIVSCSWFLSEQLATRSVQLDHIAEQVEHIAENQTKHGEQITNVEKDIIMLSAYMRPMVVYSGGSNGTEAGAETGN